MTLTVAAPTEAAQAGWPTPGHLVLLAADPAGYRSLCRLSSLIQGSPEREALARRGLSWDDVGANRDGLICLSGGRRGWIERLLRAGNLAAAQVYAGRLAGIFDDHAYLALEIHSPTDRAVADQVAALGRRLGLPTVAVQPVYCLTPDEAPRLRLLAAIRENRPLDAAEDEPAEDEAEEDERATAPRFPTVSARPVVGQAQVVASAPPQHAGADEDIDVHWLGPDEIAARFAAFPDAVGRSSDIATRCGDVLPSGRTIWPALKLPAGQTPDQALAELAHAGLRRRYASGTGDEERGTSNQQRVTSNQQPVTTNQQPVTSDQQPVTSDQQPVTGDQLPASSTQLPASSVQLPASNVQLPVPSFQLRPSTWNLPAPASTASLPRSPATAMRRSSSSWLMPSASPAHMTSRSVRAAAWPTRWWPTARTSQPWTPSSMSCSSSVS
jgi:hypothetical protein